MDDEFEMISDTFVVQVIQEEEHLIKGPVSVLLIPCLVIAMIPPRYVMVSNKSARCL